MTTTFTMTTLLFCCCCLLSLVDCKTPVAHDELTRELLDWLVDNGAEINDKIEIRHVNPNDPTSTRGVFATDHIETNETICNIPWNLTIMPEDPDESDWICDTVEAAYKAMKQFQLTPYAKYLLAQPRKYLPGSWSQPGQDLLNTMTGEDLPPYSIEDVFTDSWADYCQNVNDQNELQRHAAMLVTARADYDMLVPFYDMVNHRNGKWYNVRHQAQDYFDLIKQPSFHMVASKTIEKGDQLYNSYNQCNVCESLVDSTGTPEILKQFGFVESMPQRWLLVEPRIKFDLDYNDQNELEVVFFVPPSRYGMNFLREELKRLELFQAENHEHNTTIPKSEWDTIWAYYNALTVAIKAVLESNVELSDEVWDMEPDWWKPEGSLDLNEEYEWINDEDDDDVEEDNEDEKDEL